MNAANMILFYFFHTFLYLFQFIFHPFVVVSVYFGVYIATWYQNWNAVKTINFFSQFCYCCDWDYQRILFSLEIRWHQLIFRLLFVYFRNVNNLSTNNMNKRSPHPQSPQPQPPQHDDLIKYIHEAWHKVSHKSTLI